MRVFGFKKSGAALAAAMRQFTLGNFLADSGGHIAMMTAFGRARPGVGCSRRDFTLRR